MFCKYNVIPTETSVFLSYAKKYPQKHYRKIKAEFEKNAQVNHRKAGRWKQKKRDRIKTKSSENKKAEHNISITTLDINGRNIYTINNGINTN